MIQIKDKHNCCGCEACVQICPKHCISFKADDEGFLYPIFEKENCIDCGLCEKICPVINIREQVFPRSVWAAQNLNEDIRKQSSSGGVASMFAEKVVNDGGVVFGALFNEKWEVIHSYVENINELEAFRGSKYVQSRIGDSFINVKKFLKQNRKVLFIGTPCQISGLKCFLRKDYTNLFTVDFICHGVPSPGVFKWYLQETLNKYDATQRSENKKLFTSSVDVHSIPKGEINLPKGLEILDISFRDKQEGWKKYCFTLSLAESFVNSRKSPVLLSDNVTNNIFLKGFCSDLYLRPSCHQCPVRNFNSGSDLTIGDFWGQEYMFPAFDNDTGVSCVICKTLKGEDFFNSIKPIKKEQKTIDQVLSYNPSLTKSKVESYARKKFWKYAGKYSLEETIKKAIHLNLFERIILKVDNLK